MAIKPNRMPSLNHVEIVVAVFFGRPSRQARIDDHEQVAANVRERCQWHGRVELIHAVHGEAQNDGQKVESKEHLEKACDAVVGRVPVVHEVAVAAQEQVGTGQQAHDQEQWRILVKRAPRWTVEAMSFEIIS